MHVCYAVVMVFKDVWTWWLGICPWGGIASFETVEEGWRVLSRMVLLGYSFKMSEKHGECQPCKPWRVDYWQCGIARSTTSTILAGNLATAYMSSTVDRWALNRFVCGILRPRLVHNDFIIRTERQKLRRELFWRLYRILRNPHPS